MMKRRNFVRNVALTSLALPLRMNGFGMTAHGKNSVLLQGLENVPSLTEDRVLVIINLVGGNDGMNTVIPLSQYSNYYNLRSNIAIPTNSVLALDGTNEIGLHPAMTGMRDLYNEGLVSIVHAAGYPNPNQSHARSSDIWMTGVSANEYASTGWAGRYLEQRFAGYPAGYPNGSMEDPLALQIGYTATPTFQGTVQSNGITINDANSFYQLIGESSNLAGTDLPCCDAGDLISFIRNQQVLAVGYSAEIKQAADAGQNLATYPLQNKLADQLKIVARLIHGGLKSKIYFVSLDGFDTHSGQIEGSDATSGIHAKLMKDLSDAVKVFYQDLKLQGTDERVLSMTFSEFGRRANSNNSKGTDHGFAAPLFLIGKGITKQQIGMPPNLVSDLVPANPQPWETYRDINMQIDFRRVYADVLNDWLGNNPADTQNILFQNFGTTSVLKTTIETAKTGKWTERETWSAGRMPLPGETVLVKAGHTLQVEQNIQAFKIDVSGTLDVKPGVLINITGK
jgi:uncharacterized protein (DUF1501 family)